MKVVIVHDWLVAGGAEQVVLELHKLFPTAPIYTSYATAEWREKLDGKVVTGYLQHLGWIRKFIPFLRARWFSRLDLSEYDLIISSSGAEAKGIRAPRDALHINYCHAPTHYYWSRYDEYMKHPGFGIFDPVARWALKWSVGHMRRWDYQAAQRPDYMIANSTYTKQQIQKYYDRSAVVIHPPVETERFQTSRIKSHLTRNGFIITGRQTPYKRFDLAVEACTALNFPLTVLGDGPDHDKLKVLAGPTVEFKSWVSRQEIPNYLQSAEAFIFPGTDDFGISAVEALAAGTPVIAYKAGGALDYVIEGKTGEFFEEQSVDSLIKVLRRFDARKFDPAKISKAASVFSSERFAQKFRNFVIEKTKAQGPR